MKAGAASKRPRVVLAIKRTTYGLWVEEKQDAHFVDLVDRKDPTVARVRKTHLEHMRTVAAVDKALERLGAEVIRLKKPGETVPKADLVISVGGDGTLLAASHGVPDIPVLGVNSAPSSSVGFFCGARDGKRGELEALIGRALAGELKPTLLSRMSVSVAGRVVAARVLNDALYCHASPAATTRYIVRLGQIEEEQKSSGFWIGPAAGSTAAQRSAGGRVLPLRSQRLQLVVREPYTPHGEHYQLRHALVEPGQTLSVRSKIHDGLLFFDGPTNKSVVRFGDLIEFRRSEEPLMLLGLTTKRRWGER